MNWLRLATIVTGAVLAVLEKYFPGNYLGYVGVGLLTWSVPHLADLRGSSGISIPPQMLKDMMSDLASKGPTGPSGPSGPSAPPAACLLVGLVLASFLVGYPSTSAAGEGDPLGGRCSDSKTVCFQPEAGFDFTGIYLNGPDKGKKYLGTKSAVSAGYVLLFWADQLYATGPAVHLSANLDQASANFVGVSGGLTFCKIFHGMVMARYEGDQVIWSAIGGLSLQTDVIDLFSGSKRALSARSGL
jgi:hypothetical protein